MIRLLALVAVLLITAHQLPAPILEEATPTPTVAHKAKSKPKSESRESAKSHASQQANVKRSRFAGTWVGTMATFPYGNLATVLKVDSTETMIALTCGGAHGAVAKAKLNGDTLQATWPAGINTSTWSLTPQPDGETALVRMQAFVNNNTAVFHRTVAESSPVKPGR